MPTYRPPVRNLARSMDLYAGYAVDALESARRSSDQSTRILALNRAIANTERCLRAEVADLRAGGITWEQVGDYLGISRQAAQQRFGRI